MSDPEELNCLFWGDTVKTCQRQNLNVGLSDSQVQVFNHFARLFPKSSLSSSLFCWNFCSFKPLFCPTAPSCFLEHFSVGPAPHLNLIKLLRNVRYWYFCLFLSSYPSWPGKTCLFVWIYSGPQEELAWCLDSAGDQNLVLILLLIF